MTKKRTNSHKRRVGKVTLTSRTNKKKVSYEGGDDRGAVRLERKSELLLCLIGGPFQHYSKGEVGETSTHRGCSSGGVGRRLRDGAD